MAQVRSVGRIVTKAIVHAVWAWYLTFIAMLGHYEYHMNFMYEIFVESDSFYLNTVSVPVGNALVYNRVNNFSTLLMLTREICTNYK